MCRYAQPESDVPTALSCDCSKALLRASDGNFVCF